MTEEQLALLNLTLEDWASFGPVEKLFLDLGAELAKIPELRWVDLEAGQLEIPTESYAVQFPCVLIDFPGVDFTNEGFRNQQGLTIVQLRLAIDLYEDLHIVDGNDAPDKGTAVKRLSLTTQLYKLLEGFETDYCTPLNRMGWQTERRDDGLKVFAINFQTSVKDDSAAVVATYFTGAALQVGKG